MSKRVIRVDELTSHGGKVFASGAPNFGVDGITVALVGAHCIDITRRRCVRVPLGRRSFASRSEVDPVRYRGFV